MTASAEARLLAALSGKQGGTVVDQVDAALAAAWELSRGLNLTLPSSGGTPGPYRPGGSTWDLAVDQATARWGTAPKARTLSEKAQLLEALVAGIDRARQTAPTSTPHPTPAPVPSSGWKPLPVVTAKLATGDRSSFQNTAPQWGSSGMRIVMPASGRDKLAENPTSDPIQRCEITVAGQEGITGGRRFFRFDWTLGAGFPADAKTWQVITQWKGDGTGSPPLSVEVRDGVFCLTWHKLPTTPVGDPVPIGRATPGVHTVIVDVTFSTAAASSPVSVWMDGTLRVDRATRGATLYLGKADRVKLGFYRDASVKRAADLTLRGFAAGATLASVTG